MVPRFGIEGLRKQAARIGTLAQFIGFDNLIVGKAKDAQAQAKPNESHDALRRGRGAPVSHSVDELLRDLVLCT